MAGTDKVIKKLEDSLEGGHFYEAHEMFKTVYHRRRARGHAAEARALAARGAELQLRRGQRACGAELARMLVEALEADGVRAEPAAVAGVLALLDAFPAAPPPPAAAGGGGDAAAADAEQRAKDADAAVADMAGVVAGAGRWARRAGGSAADLAALELRLARYTTARLGWRGYGRALPHYAAAGDAGALGAAAAGAAAAVGPDDEGLLAAHAALAVAAAHGAAAARAALAAYEEARAGAAGGGGGAREAFGATPLGRGVELLLEAVAARSAPLADLAEERYGPAFDRDPALAAAVDRLREAHGLAGGGGGLGGLAALLGGGGGGGGGPGDPAAMMRALMGGGGPQ